MRLVVPLSRRSIAHTLARAQAAAPTYVATSADADSPQFALDLHEGIIGRGEQDFAKAASGLRRWATHRVVGITVFPAGSLVARGATCLVTFGAPLLAIAAPCRVTQVVDEAQRVGFTYVTLPGHPEEGEETFVVELDGHGEVRLTITARSRPGSRLAAATTPVNRLVQHRVARGYLRSLKRYIARAAS